MTDLLENRTIPCPYCGETNELEVDLSSGSQAYFEDCQVCCRPIEIRIEVDGDGELVRIEARREDE